MVCINSYYRQTSTQSVFICKDNGRCGQGNNQRSSCMMKCLIIILRFCEWFAPCILKATVKRTTKALRILPPTFKPVSQQIRLVQVACILDSDWKKYVGVTSLATKQVCLGPVKCVQLVLIFLQKVEQLSTSATTFRNLQQADIVARQIWFVGGKTRNIAIECFHMTSRRPYWCPNPVGV